MKNAWLELELSAAINLFKLYSQSSVVQSKFNVQYNVQIQIHVHRYFRQKQQYSYRSNEQKVFYSP